MEPFRTLTGVAASFPQDDVDTDQILPTPYLRDMKADLSEGLFAYLRRTKDGGRNTDFVLEQPAYTKARILVVGRNFGCGSSREHAVWSVKAFGIGCVIAESFAEVFRENCLRNGILPIVLSAPEMAALHERVQRLEGAQPLTVDLQQCLVIEPDGHRTSFEMAAAERSALLEGLDDTGLTLRQSASIDAWERRMLTERPFMQITKPLATVPGPGDHQAS